MLEQSIYIWNDKTMHPDRVLQSRVCANFAYDGFKGMLITNHMLDGPVFQGEGVSDLVALSAQRRDVLL